MTKNQKEQIRTAAARNFSPQKIAKSLGLKIDEVRAVLNESAPAAPKTAPAPRKVKAKQAPALPTGNYSSAEQRALEMLAAGARPDAVATATRLSPFRVSILADELARFNPRRRSARGHRAVGGEHAARIEREPTGLFINVPPRTRQDNRRSL